MENLPNQEKFENWVRPNLKNERSEIERTLREFIGLSPNNIDIENILASIESAPITQLTEADWAQLENTDSFDSVRPGHLEDVEQIIEEYNQDQSRGTQRNVQTLVDAFNTGAEMEAPVILKNESVKMHLVSGNTRLMVARALGIQPRVIIAKYK